MANTQVMSDMRQSIQRVNSAAPIIKRLMKGGEIKTVEGDDNEICKLLDMTCGTEKNGFRPFNTFTVRKARESGATTEYEKRQYAINHGGIYPYLTMQMYVSEGDERVLSLGIAKTTDIIEFVEKGYAEENHTGKEQIGQSAFYVVRWDEMRNKGYKVLVWDDRE